MSTLKGFWGSYTAQPVKESRFGIIPAGEWTVKIIDVQGMLASETCQLDDNGMITNIRTKVDKDGVPTFDKTFDQDLAVIVFQDQENHVLLHRRSSTGWLTPLDVDPKTKQLLATPEIVARYGFKLISDDDGKSKYAVKRPNRKQGETEYVGRENKFKSADCEQIMDRLCSACEVESPNDLIGKYLDIRVESETYRGKVTNDVTAYAKAGAGFKAKAVKATTATAQIVTPAIASLTIVKDDLPF